VEIRTHESAAGEIAFVENAIAEIASVEGAIPKIHIRKPLAFRNQADKQPAYERLGIDIRFELLIFNVDLLTTR
jgi:hypothetical protein